MNQTPLPSSLIIFDGVCNFCNAAVNFIIKHDAKAKFSFTTIQSATGQALLKNAGISPLNPNTLVLLQDKEILLMSSAALEVAKHLDGYWRCLSWLKIVPGFIRDAVYQLVARNRYKLMGKRGQCMVPTPEVRERFID